MTLCTTTKHRIMAQPKISIEGVRENRLPSVLERMIQIEIDTSPIRTQILLSPLPASDSKICSTNADSQYTIRSNTFPGLRSD